MFLAFRDSGAKDWNSNLAIALDHSGAQDKLQFHHIFPKALLLGVGHTPREADDIANLAFIGGMTNRKISDRAPSDYLAKLRDDVGAEMLIAQCIPLEDELLHTDSYERFLTRRRELIAERLNFFLGTTEKSGFEIPADPLLRDLDHRIEQVELSLRGLVGRTLQSGGAELPPHINVKLQERMASVARTRPGDASVRDTTLSGRLPFCDLRDLQDIITAKALWPMFESTFGTKEALNGRCGQIAELRNTIRHSRPLGEVTRKDGEAGLLWFGQALAR